MSLRVYTPVGPLLRCSTCAAESIARGVDPHDAGIIVDGDTHDRWHAERDAIADPNQASLFG